MRKIASFFVCLILFSAGEMYARNSRYEKNQIQPWRENFRFWQYKGKPILLLGGSNDDNLFQWPPEMLTPHLDEMKKIGANYVRNTMSDRKDVGFELYPFKQLENGDYDLNQWNEEYWHRFDFFLKETAKRKIIVQIELWDRFDFYQENWIINPYNPNNNINYTQQESGLGEEYPFHAMTNRQPFFFSTPQQQNNHYILPIQKRFIEKMLSYTLQYDHILYCIDNETSGEELWSIFWSEFIGEKANEQNKKISVTEMWDDWNLQSSQHKRTFDHPTRFQFCDISQNTHQRGDRLWNNLRWAFRYIEDSPRPLNVVKTYGSDEGKRGHGNSKDAIERWWLHLLGGAAAIRFHRPDSGLGLSELAASSIKAARQLESIVKVWNLQPGNELLIDRSEGSAYLSYIPDKVYVAFLPNGGNVRLRLNETPSSVTLRYLNIRTGKWSEKNQTTTVVKDSIEIVAPDNNEWLIVITKK